HPRQVYKSGDGSDISAVVSYSIQIVPLLAKGKYNFLPEAVVQPYLALGAGGNLIAYRQFAGEFSNSSKTKFGFAVSPEAGVRIPVGKAQKAAINLSAGYNYMPFKYDGIERLDNVSVRAGVAFPLN
ncbi:MAG: outer membrane beta-barrel protein, partial [Gemmatimonadaceae bacterium]|nr:outer membrane beta-barrel protein [Chitinophagaceae bacterium]